MGIRCVQKIKKGNDRVRISTGCEIILEVLRLAIELPKDE